MRGGEQKNQYKSLAISIGTLRMKKTKKKKKRVKKPTKKQKKKTVRPSGKKVTVGEDEFCPTCMEWRPYDEITGKCSVCGHRIKKVSSRAHTINEEFDLKDFTVEHDEQQETGDY